MKKLFLFLVTLLTFVNAFATVSSLSLLPDGYPAFAGKRELSSRNLAPITNAFTFNPTGIGSTSYNWVIPDHCYLNSITGFFNGQTAGDYIAVKIVDVDNVLGYGAGATLSTPVTKYFINPTANELMKIEMGYPVFMLQGLYIQVIYTSTNLLANVHVYVNILADKVFQ